MLDRRSFIVLGGAAALSACGGGNPMPFGSPSVADNGQYGADAAPDAELLATQEAIAPDGLAGTYIAVTNPAPSTVKRFLLSNLPVVATQGTPTTIGSPGTCEAQSFGYGLGSYTAARTLGGGTKWDAANATYQPSAGWLYQWEHNVWESGARACPKGSGATPYAIRLVTSGRPSTAQVPYNPNGYTTVSQMCAYLAAIDLSQPWPNAANFIVGSYKGFKNITNKKATYLDTFRHLIRNGHAIAFSGLVPYEYGPQPTLTNHVFTAPKGFIPDSGHGQVIVGFDDGKGTNGAFLVQNSFGPAWNAGSGSDPGRNGRVWYDYDAFFAGQKYALIMFPTTVDPVSGILLATTALGAPEFAVKNVRILHVAATQSSHALTRLVVVSHASDALNILKFTATDPGGFSFGSAIDEHHRVGYTYVDNVGGDFKPGTYQLA
ncbi:MAG: hypothetical protein ACLQPV_06865 [Vulcanimicrobiaceae bacterium]